MKKRLILIASVLVALIAAYSGASMWSGFRIQEQSYAAVDAINLHLSRTWSDQIRLTARNYQRGIFSSQASYILTFPSKQDSATATKREILFVNEISHGPFPLKNILNGDFSAVGAVIDTHIASTPWTEALFNTNQNRPFVVGQTRVATNGVAKLLWTAAAFDLRQDALRVQFGGAQLKAEIGPRFRNRKGELTLDALNMTDGHTTIDLKGVKLETDAKSGALGLPVGINKREIASLAWSSVNAPTLELEKVKLRTELALDDAEVSGETRIDIHSLSIAQKKMGSFKLGVTLDKLSDRALLPLIELYNRTLIRLMSHILAPEALSAAEIKKIWLQLHGLLKNSPSIRIEPLLWETPAGKSQLTLSAVLKPAELANGGLGLRESLINTLDATLTVSQPMVNALVLQSMQTPGSNPAKVKGLADRESRRLADLAAQLKLGRVQNGLLVSHFNVQNDALRINGQRTSAEPILKLLSTFVPSAWLANQAAAGQVGPDEASALQHLDPSILAAILSDADFTYQESRDADGDLVLNVAPSDLGANKIEIIFSGCRKDPTCEDVLLRATYPTNQTAPLKFVNDWNLRNRWARVFINDLNAPVLEMDISAYGGIGQDAIEGMVSTFFKLVREFSVELKAAEKAAADVAEKAAAEKAAVEAATAAKAVTPESGSSTLPSNEALQTDTPKPN
ncbi:DUF945 family protein [Zwartia sp.]|uniref:DUF945 family protein n=1 Tax=Zwartia sp. TaxID=2978004 RepID=UPI003BB00D6F